ncbi:hypothetical protein HNR31_000085 [Anoxybacillus caldiproteolyticus]|uniref:Uncharacterized protein n=1 Tax=Thermaerobacillus caldiproteolyticus TaxID=247480 RepID=A0A7V9Z3F7_9BACL|nr:hypothetical protein [Anoxybacillus caldiproteolyticus]
MAAFRWLLTRHGQFLGGIRALLLFLILQRNVKLSQTM